MASNIFKEVYKLDRFTPFKQNTFKGFAIYDKHHKEHFKD